MLEIKCKKKNRPRIKSTMLTFEFIKTVVYNLYGENKKKYI